MPRLQSWFENFKEAKTAASERKEHRHLVAKMTKKNKKEVVGYYVGQRKHIRNLSDRYDVHIY